MNRFFPIVLLIASAAYAADPEPAKAPAEPAAAEKVAEKPAAPAKEAAKASAPECAVCPKPVECPKAAACAKPVACPEPTKPEAPKAGIGCAKALEDLIKGYRKAADDLQAFMEASSEKVKDSAKKEKAMQETVKKNEAEVTELKFKNTREAKKKVRALQRTNRELWKKLRGINKQSSMLCKEISKSNSDKIREINNDLRQRLTRAKALMR